MAEFKAGDRVVKMSGTGAGKYGTVNSVMDNGTLNVTFDGEKIPRFCDPMRCGQVAANDVKFTNPNYKPEAGMRFLDENFSMFDPKVAKAMIEDARKKGVKVPPGVVEKARRAGLIANACRAANAKFKAANAAPKGLTQTTKLRLKEDFTDEYGSYKKGSVFPMYAMGGINPKFGTMVVPGRGVTLQIPWEKLEVVNACARNADPKAYDHSGRLVKVGDTLETRKGLAEIVRIKGLQGRESVASWVGVSYKPGGKSVDEWLMCGMHGVLGVGVEAQNAVARNAGRYELVEHDMGRSFGVYDSATSGYIADDIPLRDAMRILKTKGETAEQVKKNLEWVSPSAVDKLW